VSATGAYSFLELEAIGTLLARLADILTQTFYNIPVNDPLTQTMSHFDSMTEVVNDALGHANCLGSGYVMRRVALESIGGFPTESLAEDICCSATLLGEGWKTAFVPEVVQYGSAPESYLGHIKQRTRWVSLHSNICWLFQKVYVVCTNLLI
jgi:cellulose synthase/poly-beta-1,6-N-acetylglucosamine synthase-like glycosyltransferase